MNCVKRTKTNTLVTLHDIQHWTYTSIWSMRPINNTSSRWPNGLNTLYHLHWIMPHTLNHTLCQILCYHKKSIWSHQIANICVQRQENNEIKPSIEQLIIPEWGIIINLIALCFRRSKTRKFFLRAYYAASDGHEKISYKGKENLRPKPLRPAPQDLHDNVRAS